MLVFCTDRVYDSKKRKLNSTYGHCDFGKLRETKSQVPEMFRIGVTSYLKLTLIWEIIGSSRNDNSEKNEKEKRKEI